MLEQMELAGQLSQVRVNFDGVIYCTRQALPMLRRTQGSLVISMASLSAIYGVPTHAVYSATKSAVFALTEALALELEQHAIRVCDVYVGYVNTPLLTSSDQHVPKETALLQSANLWTSPENVATVVYQAATGDAHLGQLHIPVDRKSWLARKLATFS